MTESTGPDFRTLYIQHQSMFPNEPSMQWSVCRKGFEKKKKKNSLHPQVQLSGSNVCFFLTPTVTKGHILLLAVVAVTIRTWGLEGTLMLYQEGEVSLIIIIIILLLMVLGSVSGPCTSDLQISSPEMQTLHPSISAIQYHQWTDLSTCTPHTSSHLSIFPFSD